MQGSICNIANPASAILHRDRRGHLCFSARMDEARTRAEAAVRQAMADTGLSATALARAAGMSPSTLTRFLAGGGKSILSTVSVAKIQKVAASYGTASRPGAKPANNPSEDILLAAFRNLSESEQETLLEYLDFLLARRGKQELVNDRAAG